VVVQSFYREGGEGNGGTRPYSKILIIEKEGGGGREGESLFASPHGGKKETAS